MSVDLSLLIITNPGGQPHKGLWLGHDHILLGSANHNEFLELMETDALKQQEVPEGVHCFQARIPDGSLEDEKCYGTIEEDEYGKRLKYTTARDILDFAKAHRDKIGENIRITAALVYIRVIARKHPNWHFVLYWH